MNHNEEKTRIPAQPGPLGKRIRILDFLALVACAVLVCTFAVGGSVLAELYHVNSVWLIVSLISLVFFAGACLRTGCLVCTLLSDEGVGLEEGAASRDLTAHKGLTCPQGLALGLAPPFRIKTPR